MTPPATATVRLASVRLRHPVRNEPAHVFTHDAWRDAARTLLRHRRGVEIVHAIQSIGPTAQPDVAAHLARVATTIHGESRRAHGLAWWWTGVGVVATLLVAWFDSLTDLLTALTATGGAAFTVTIGLIPAILAWRHAWGHASRARDAGAIARAIGSARVRRSQVLDEGNEDVDAFGREYLPSLTELDNLVSRLPESPLEACSRAAALALTISRGASRHGLAPVADAYHELYVILSVADIQGVRTEQSGGMLADSRVRTLLRRAFGTIQSALAPFSVSGSVRSSLFMPLAGASAAALAIVVTTFVTGLFVVAPDTAVIIEPPEARLARGLESMGLEAALLGLDSGARTVIREPGIQNTWPPPFADRRAVALGEQFTAVRAIVTQTGPDSFTVIQIRVRFRIADLAQWARYDTGGSGPVRLGRAISSELQGRIEVQNRDLVQRASRDPALAQNPRVLMREVEQVMVAQLPAILNQFNVTIGSSDAAREAGVRVEPIRQADIRLDRNVTGGAAGIQVSP